MRARVRARVTEASRTAPSDIIWQDTRCPNENRRRSSATSTSTKPDLFIGGFFDVYVGRRATFRPFSLAREISENSKAFSSSPSLALRVTYPCHEIDILFVSLFRNRPLRTSIEFLSLSVSVGT